MFVKSVYMMVGHTLTVMNVDLEKDLLEIQIYMEESLTK